MNPYDRLTRILRCLGWGPKVTESKVTLIAFCREPDGSGWRVGDGVIRCPWGGFPSLVPEDRDQALLDIEIYLHDQGELDVSPIELLSRVPIPAEPDK